MRGHGQTSPEWPSVYSLYRDTNINIQVFVNYKLRPLYTYVYMHAQEENILYVMCNVHGGYYIIPH